MVAISRAWSARPAWCCSTSRARDLRRRSCRTCMRTIRRPEERKGSRCWSSSRTSNARWRSPIVPTSSIRASSCTKGPTAELRDDAPARSAPRVIGSVNAMDTNALHGRKRPAQGAKAKAGRAPGEPLQRSDGRFRQQPEGNGCPGAPLFVALLAKTASLGFVGCRDWRPMPTVRVCAHSVNRP
mgnify:CR=1 FL=1